MNRPAEAGRARVAIVGAPTVEGTHLRQALAEHGVPGRQVDLYGSTAGEVVLSEYAGEARLIQDPELEEVARHELIFVCESGEVVSRLAAAAPSSVIIDLGEFLPGEASTRPVRLEVEPEAARGGTRFAVPHPLALVLAEVLRPLESGFGVAEAMAVVIRPAADFGQEGVEELREQTVGLLNFSSVPVATFGRQLAFNIIPGARVAGAGRALESRLAREVTGLVGWDERRVTVRLLAAPLFHGHALQLRFRLVRPAALAAVRSALDQPGLLSGQEAATPLDVPGDACTRVSDLSEDGLGGFWLWGVVGEAASRSARQAVKLAAALHAL